MIDQISSSELLLVDGQIYTGSPWQSTTSALAIKDGVVTSLGDEALSEKSRFSISNIIPLNGATVLPGFIDSHVHLHSLGEWLSQLQFSADSNKGAIQDALRKEVQRKQAGEWITGGKWSTHSLGEIPTRKFLDEVAPDNPVALHSRDMHSVLLNSRALQILEITISTISSGQGEIVKDAGGEPTGLLLENAVRLYQETKPEVDFNTLREYHVRAAEYCLSHGITAVHSIEEFQNYQRYEKLHRTNQLDIRMGLLIYKEDLPELIDGGIKSGDGDEFLWFIGTKIFMDGALGSRTAWMKEPYSREEGRGDCIISGEELTEIVSTAHENTLSVAIHAIGDAAVAEALTVLGQSEPPGFLRDRIEHFQLFDPGDLNMLPPSLIASMQPVHLLGDRALADSWWGDRSRYAYAFQTLLEQNTVLAFGSDAPVEQVNPWRGIQAAVERREKNETPPWYPGECITLEDALTAYTANSASAAYRTKNLGSLNIGASGDAVVLNRNPWENPPIQLSSIRPTMTILNGNIVYSDE